jgi:signal peptidase
MKQLFRWGKYSVIIGSVLLLCLSVSLILSSRLMGSVRFYSVTSGSMAPGIPTGSLVMTRTKPPADLKVGEIITFLQPGYADRYVTHRINRIQINEKQWQFITKGDANSIEDAWLISPDTIKGVVIYSIPLLGRVSQAIQTRLGVILGVILPVGILIVLELRYLLSLLVESALEDKQQGTDLVLKEL